MAVHKQRCLPYIGNVPIFSPIYISSEGLLGVNMRPATQRPGYVLVPGDTYVEFLPVDSQGLPSEGQQPLQATEVEVGGQYEVVVTNVSGLYRYRLGDVVEVVGFFNQIPLIDFLFRAGQMLNVHAEKLTERSFTSALQAAVAAWEGLELRDFTAAESVLGPERLDPPRYLVFIETEGGVPTERQRQMIDEKLCEQNYVYKSFRVKNAIGPMQVMPVARDTFADYRNHVVGSSQVFVSQFKQPRVLRTEQQVQFFMDRRIDKA